MDPGPHRSALVSLDSLDHHPEKIKTAAFQNFKKAFFTYVGSVVDPKRFFSDPTFLDYSGSYPVLDLDINFSPGCQSNPDPTWTFCLFIFDK